MAGYLGSVPVPQATQHRESFTCTEGQTSFATAGYTAQFVDVYLNGSHLSPADFTATNGSDVVLAVAASADDVCDIISYTPFEVADQTFTGNTIMTNGDNTAQLTLTSTDADASVGPVLDLFRNSSSPADSDQIGKVNFIGRNDNSQNVTYANIKVTPSDVTDGTEDGRIDINTVLDGTDVSRILLNSTSTVINQDSKDLDFRVESDTKTHMLFVDASTDRVGINENSPDARLHISDSAVSTSFVRIENTGSHEGSIQFKTAHSAASDYRLGASISESNNFELFNVDADTGFIKVGSEGAVRMPLQPAFTVLNAALNNIQVATAETTVPFNREAFDRNNDFDSSNYTFTAPVQGTYQLTAQFRMRGLQNDINYIYFNLVTTNRSVANIFEYSGADDADYHTVNVTLLADMAATHTAVCKVYQSGGSAETDLEIDTCIFSGFLVG